MSNNTTELKVKKTKKKDDKLVLIKVKNTSNNYIMEVPIDLAKAKLKSKFIELVNPKDRANLA